MMTLVIPGLPPTVTAHDLPAPATSLGLEPHTMIYCKLCVEDSGIGGWTTLKVQKFEQFEVCGVYTEAEVTLHSKTTRLNPKP